MITFVKNIDELKQKPQVVKLAEMIKKYEIDVSLLNDTQVNKTLERILIAIR